MPVALMLDHGKSPDQCARAVDMGFTDVMYDGSTLPIEENIANTAHVVEMAHRSDIGVEAELGHVGRGGEYTEYGARRRGFTDPDSVARFVAETDVDMLAVAVGTAHGVYNGEPNLDLDLLSRIRKRVEIPLVLHGGSGLSEEQFRGAIAAGIAKINVATDLVRTAGSRLRESAVRDDASFFAMMKAVHEAMHERCSHYFDLFGASGRGDEQLQVITATSSTAMR
jgi:fructose-bisphosphate aldolase class II